jgi:16S rRNA (uracil1498-N3)-methyltransferase
MQGGRAVTARLFLPPDHLAAQTVTVTGDAFDHLCRVLRLDVQDSVLVFDGAGREYEARIVRRALESAELLLGPARTVPPPALALTLIVGLPKGDKMDLVVQKATELGVTAIAPAVTARSIPRRDASRGEKQLARWRKIAAEAARQSGRGEVPRVDAEAPLAQAIARLTPGGARLMFWEAAEAPALRSRLPAEKPVRAAVLIGPEGGLAPEEVVLARRQGFEPVSLGARILRAETAAIAVVAVLGHVWGDLG